MPLFLYGFYHGSFSFRHLAVLPRSIRFVCSGVNPIGAPVAAGPHDRLSSSARRCKGDVLSEVKVTCAFGGAELTCSAQLLPVGPNVRSEGGRLLGSRLGSSQDHHLSVHFNGSCLEATGTHAKLWMCGSV